MSTQNKPLPAVALLLDSNRGVYIPQHFADGFDNWKGISEEQRTILKIGPEHDLYWEVWDSVLCSAYYEQDDNTWELYQDGDLWAICTAQMTDEEKHNFGFE